MLAWLTILTILETVSYYDPLPLWISGTDNRFTINLTINIPSQPILYKPSFFEVIKFAWIQFVCLAVALHYLAFRCLAQYVYTHQIVQTTVENDAQPAKDRYKF